MRKPYELWGTKDGVIQCLQSYSTMKLLKRAWVKEKDPTWVGPFKAKVIVDDGRIDITDQMPRQELREYTSAEERDRDIIENAAYFTIVRFLGVGQYERHERPSRKEAEELGYELSEENRANYMIYAVNKKDLSALVTTIIFRG